ncbi:MAG TPA: hypothetical protein VD833_19600 [Vicinamibacterales bacterium]|nr:hypothetical protein [Vicinamibacterales bacterium]
MTAHGYVQLDRQSRRVVRRNGLLALGWPHFSLFVAILGGLLALVALVFVIAYFPA